MPSLQSVINIKINIWYEIVVKLYDYWLEYIHIKILFVTFKVLYFLFFKIRILYFCCVENFVNTSSFVTKLYFVSRTILYLRDQNSLTKFWLTTCNNSVLLDQENPHVNFILVQILWFDLFQKVNCRISSRAECQGKYLRQ